MGVPARGLVGPPSGQRQAAPPVTTLGLVAALVLGYALVSRRVEGSPVTAPLVFTVAGLLLGGAGADLLALELEREAVLILAEATLVVVLFTDAARIDLSALRRDAQLPARLLAVGLPLTVAAGTGAALLLLADLSLAEAALLAAVLAPTDAALGQAVVSSEALPLRVRQSLSVESGLNDGIALPLVTVLLAAAAAGGDPGGAAQWSRFAVAQIGGGLAAGVVVGAGGGRLLDAAVSRGWVAGAYRQLAVLAIAAGAYAGAEAVGGNGFVAAFVAGVAFGRVAAPHCTHAADFAEDEGELLTLLVFCVFGASLVGPALTRVTLAQVGYAVLSLTVVRMVPVGLSLVGARLRGDTVGLLAWFGPRGVASILFATLVVERAAADVSDRIADTVMLTVLLSVVAHGVTSAPLARAYATRHATLREGGRAMAEDRPSAPVVVGGR